MAEKMSEAEKARLARGLRRLLPAPSNVGDVILSNGQAAQFLGGISIKTLGRMAFPNDLDGPIPIRFSKNGNVYWSKRELEAYTIRKRIRLETNLMDSVDRQSLITDLLDF